MPEIQKCTLATGVNKRLVSLLILWCCLSAPSWIYMSDLASAPAIFLCEEAVLYFSFPFLLEIWYLISTCMSLDCLPAYSPAHVPSSFSTTCSLLQSATWAFLRLVTPPPLHNKFCPSWHPIDSFSLASLPQISPMLRSGLFPPPPPPPPPRQRQWSIRQWLKEVWSLLLSPLSPAVRFVYLHV